MKKVLILHCPGYDNSIKIIAYWIFILWDILIKNWYEVEIVHLWLFDGDIYNYIENNKFDYICVSLHWFYQLRQTIDVCKEIKNKFAIPIIWGWITLSYYEEEFNKLKIFDYIIKWDWEYKLLNLLDNLSLIERKEIVEQVDFINFSLLRNYKEYLKINFYNPKSDENIFYLNYWKWCENVCMICSWNARTTKKIYWRDKSLYYNSSDFINSIINWYNKYNLQSWYISFHTKVNEDIYISMFKILKEKSIDLKLYFELFFIPSISFLKGFSNYASKNSLLLISPESWDEEIRNKSRTAYSFTNKDFYNFLELANRLKLNLHISFSVGLFNEDINAFIKTLKMINYVRNKYNYNISVSAIDIEPWSIISENSLVSADTKTLDEFIDFKMWDIWYSTQCFSKDEIKEIHLLAQAEINCKLKVSYFLQEIISGYTWDVYEIKYKCNKCKNYSKCFEKIDR